MPLPLKLKINNTMPTDTEKGNKLQRRGKVHSGWEWAGRTFDILSKPINVSSDGLIPQKWVVIRFHDEFDPTLLKHDCIKETKPVKI
jgi:hypothetical protein